MKRGAVGTVVIGLLLASCGGSEVAETPTTSMATTTSTTSTSTTMAATTTNPTTTTSTSTTTTTTLPPASVDGWDGAGPSEVSVVYLGPNGDIGLASAIGTLTRGLRLGRADTADIRVEVDVAIIAWAVQHDGEPCYAVADVEGTLALVDSTGANSTLVAQIDGRYPDPVPMVLLGCNHPDPEDAPFRYAFEPDLVSAAVAWWGEGAVPYLERILHADHYVFDARLEAIQALRLMDWDEIPPDQQYEVLHSSLWFVNRIAHMSNDVDDARRYRASVEKLCDEVLDWELELPVTGDPAADRLSMVSVFGELRRRF